MILKEMYPGMDNSPDTKLTASIGPTDTVISVENVGVFPDGPNYAVIGNDNDAELIKYAVKTTNSLSGCTRGFGALPAKAWQSGEPIARNITNTDLMNLIENILNLDIGKVDKVAGMGLSTNDYDNPAKTKVDAIPDNPKYTDTVYTHPANHEAAMITESAARVFVTQSQRTNMELKTNKGAVNGYAGLDAAGKVPASQLPSYVDDVLEFNARANFPATGENGKIYIALDSNLTYRWTGSAYTEISASLALGETPQTAFAGDKGKTAYEHSQAAGNVHGLTKAIIVALGIPAQDTTYDVATTTTDGLMPSTDKVKMDNIEVSGIKVYASTDTIPTLPNGAVALIYEV